MTIPPLAVIGGGNMGSAIIAGGVRAGVVEPSGVVVAEPDPEKRRRLTTLGVVTVANAAEALAWLDQSEAGRGEGQVLFAVKPQMLPAVLTGVGATLERTPRVVVSILAGTPTSKIESAVPGSRVIRAMPNLPARLRRGITAVCRGESAREGDDLAARTLMGAVGEVVELPEHLMDAFTAVAGSGPAYVFYLAEAMERAAGLVGFDAAQARVIVRATLRGASALLADGDNDPAELRAAVTSKGGTTAAAVGELDRADVMGALSRAIVAARDRGVELAAE